MGSKTVTINPKGDGVTPKATLGIQSDVAFNEAAKRLCGRDLCSIADLTVEEVAAILELAHAVKNNPEDFRHALDGKQMVLFFEKASLRTRITFEAAATRCSSIRRSPRWESANPYRTSPTMLSGG
jgi:ornithine carbamoyltransferase